jgi:hypothetical protein
MKRASAIKVVLSCTGLAENKKEKKIACRPDTFFSFFYNIIIFIISPRNNERA